MTDCIPPRNRIIHKALLSAGSGGAKATPICGIGRILDHNQEFWVYGDHPKSEVTCPKCRARMGIPEDIVTLQELLLDNVAIRLSIFRYFEDALFWNEQRINKTEAHIIPDEHATLATEFLLLTEQFNESMKPLVAFMEEHAAKFGWADEIIVREINCKD